MMMMSASSGGGPRGESEIFNIVRRLIEETRATFPNADKQELMRTIDAVKTVIDEKETE